MCIYRNASSMETNIGNLYLSCIDFVNWVNLIFTSFILAQSICVVGYLQNGLLSQGGWREDNLSQADTNVVLKGWFSKILMLSFSILGIQTVRYSLLKQKSCVLFLFLTKLVNLKKQNKKIHCITFVLLNLSYFMSILGT